MPLRFQSLRAWLLPAVIAICGPSQDIQQKEDCGRDSAYEVPARPDVDRARWKLVGPEAVATEVRGILGTKHSRDTELDASIIILKQDNTPYLSQRIVERPLWKVVLRDWAMELPSTPPGVHDKYSRTLDIFLDPIDGKLMKIRSRWPEAEPPMAPEPSAELAIKQMTRVGREKYHRFPDRPPNVSFMDAMETLESAGESVMMAKQIIAHYVVWSKAGQWQEPRPVWAITLRGVPRIRSRDENALTQHRYIVDAKTGKYLCGSNTPRPEGPPAAGD
jgi:hypothetical protein